MLPDETRSPHSLEVGSFTITDTDGLYHTKNYLVSYEIIKQHMLIKQNRNETGLDNWM